VCVQLYSKAVILQKPLHVVFTIWQSDMSNACMIPSLLICIRSLVKVLSIVTGSAFVQWLRCTLLYVAGSTAKQG
jgi:hypothetical protein